MNYENENKWQKTKLIFSFLKLLSKVQREQQKTHFHEKNPHIMNVL